MAPPNVAPVDCEREFDLSELFFSETDTRGVIRSGNAVFARVSGFPLEAMAGRPHNIIRHPDMPRGAFRLLWGYLEAGRPVACYVKNMAADGRYYWVLALAVPVPGGYLSVRFKPSTPFFATVRELYKQMRAAEQAEEETPDGRKRALQASQEVLERGLCRAGFPDYDAFIQAALAAELAHRDAMLASRGRSDSEAVGGPEPLHQVFRAGNGAAAYLRVLFTEVEAFLSAAERLEGKLTFLLDLAQGVRRAALNAYVGASRQPEGQARVLAVVADRMAEDAQGCGCVIRSIAAEIRPLASSLRATAFGLSSARLQADMVKFFAKESLQGEGAGHLRQNLEALACALRGSVRGMLDALQQVSSTVCRLGMQTEELWDALRLLGQVHVTGKVEAARTSQGAHMGKIFDEVCGRVQAAKEELKELSAAAAQMRERTAHVSQSARPILQAIEALSAAVSEV